MTTMSLADVKARLSEPVGSVQAHHAQAFAAFELIKGPLLDYPYRVGRRLLAPFDDRYSARRGSYRIIYRIDDKARTVTVVDGDHRSGVYKPH